MSNRNQDATIIQQLRNTEDRLRRLESQNNKTRKNDVRLSDTVVTADSPNDRLCLENLESGAVVCIGADTGDPPQAMWSFSGDLTGHEDEFSPPFFVERDTTARQIVIGHNQGEPFTGTVTVCVNFREGAVTLRADLVGGSSQFVVYEINVPLDENDPIHCELIDAGTNAENISVFVRFGTPTVGLSVDTCAF